LAPRSRVSTHGGICKQNPERGFPTNPAFDYLHEEPAFRRMIADIGLLRFVNPFA
jgi:hypothetical protein